MTANPLPKPLTIGVFDSGFGGLTVLRELLHLIPNARFIYLGDTARLPYGSKSQATIARYAISSTQFLLDQGADLLVIACNTATALAINNIRSVAGPVPVIGVIDPGTQAAFAADPSGHVLVLATAATVHSEAYSQAIHSLRITSTEKACPLLVPLVEEGWTDHPVTAEVARIYLSEALAIAPEASTLLLGCTHYPLLKSLLSKALHSLHHPLKIIDSAYATAQAVLAHLPASPPLADQPQPLTVFATDSVEKFERLGPQFLGRSLPVVTLVDLGG